MINNIMLSFKRFYESSMSEFAGKHGYKDYSDLIGKHVKIHPNAGANYNDDAFMEWSIYVNIENSYKRIALVKSVELENVESVVNHASVDKYQRSITGSGAKTVNVYITGIIKDIEFDSNKLKQKLSSGGYSSVTYNPHKNPEYVYMDCLDKPEYDWWYKDERFFPLSKGKEHIEQRKKASIERNVKFPDECLVSTKISDKQSTFSADSCILVQHKKFNEREDYMWVKGVS